MNPRHAPAAPSAARRKSGDKPKRPAKHKRPRSSPSRGPSRGFIISLLIALLVLLALAIGVFAGAYAYFASRLTEAMAGPKWDVPSRLYPEPLVLEVDTRLPPGPFDETLKAMGYLKTNPVTNPGDYREAAPGRYYVKPRPGWPGQKVSDQPIEIQVRNGVVASVKLVQGKGRQPIVRAFIPPVPFAELRGEAQGSRQPLKYHEFPKVLRDAVVAIEDQRFYSHHGLDPRGLARAVFVNVVRHGRSQGGSTLTQQLVKNHFLSQEKTFWRKFKEMFYALALERRYSKNQILEMYLNEIYLGQKGSVSIAGMAQAAYAYFAKDVRQLNLSEAATLAGLIQRPNVYAPDRHPDKARARRDVVLQKMLEQGLIDRAAYDTAIKQPVKSQAGRYLGRTAPYFVDYVTDLVSAKFPDDTAFDKEGYTIGTTLDMRVQVAAQDALSRGLARLDRATKAPLEGAVVALQPSTGRILAMVGGRDYGQSQFNRATLARRQPGSVGKPLVLLAAIQAKGTDLGPTTVLKDEPITITLSGKDWSPQNNDKQFHGDVTLRQVLEQSLNVPTVRLSQEVGIDHVVDLYRELRFSGPLKPLPSLALGAFEASPLEIAAAFTVLATDGVLHPPYAIEEIRDRDGQVQKFDEKPQPKRIVPPSQAFMVRDMMRGVLERGTAKASRTLGYTFEASGKTGTTNDFKDAWFVGFDADLLVVVWVGSDQPIATGFTGGRAALPIWVDVMKAVRQSSPPPKDPVPDGIIEVKVCPLSLELPSDHCPTTIREVYWTGTEPTQLCHVHATLLESVGEAFQQLPGIFHDLFKGTQD
jgi:penicillin-binding protein 1B